MCLIFCLIKSQSRADLVTICPMFFRFLYAMIGLFLVIGAVLLSLSKSVMCFGIVPSAVIGYDEWVYC